MALVYGMVFEDFVKFIMCPKMVNKLFVGDILIFVKFIVEIEIILFDAYSN